MLCLNIIRTLTLRTGDRAFIRNLRSRSRAQDVGPNPGLNQRLAAFRKDGININTENAEEFIEGSESDLIHASDAYQKHLHETFIGKHIMPKMIVKEKYFKEHMPNLLTWSEKEQIRHLATVHPDEWTPERIAESFPVTAAVVRKLLKFPWKPATQHRISRHDASAMRNWRELKEGTLGIPEELREHFMKFSDRIIPPLSSNSIKIDVTPKQDIGEFERIVAKCAAKEKDNIKLDEPTDVIDDASNENRKRDKNLMTLGELTNKIKTRLDSGRDVDQPDKLMVDSVKSIEATKQEPNHQLVFEEDKSTALMEKKEDVVIKAYPERIRIPKKAYKRGATYKVNDCFYDDDGRILYRVIGMTGK